LRFPDDFSFAHDFHDHTLWPLAVEFGVKDTPRPSEVQLAGRDGQQHLVVHEDRFQVGIAVVFAGLVVLAKWR
jgi:hypothetical protein